MPQAERKNNRMTKMTNTTYHTLLITVLCFAACFGAPASAQEIERQEQQNPIDTNINNNDPATGISDLESNPDTIRPQQQPTQAQQNAAQNNQGDLPNIRQRPAEETDPFASQDNTGEADFNDGETNNNPNRTPQRGPRILRNDESYDLLPDPQDREDTLAPVMRDSDLEVQQDLPPLAPIRNRQGRNLDPSGQPIRIPLENGTVSRQRVDGRTPQQRTANTREEIMPYQALGMPLGSFYLFPSLTIRESYTDNVFISATSKKSDGALIVAPGFVLESNWDNHALEFSLNGVATYHHKFRSQDTKNLNALLRGRIDVTNRTFIRLGTGYQLNQETGSSPDFPTNAAGPSDVETKNLFGELNHRFNRLSVQFRGEHSQLDYGDATSVNGQAIDNNNRDRNEDAALSRLTYEFSPRLSVFMDNNFRWTNYDAAESATNINRDNFQMLNAAGFRAEITPLVNGELRVGNVMIDPKSARLSKENAVVVDASLVWTPTELTTLRASLATTIAETTEIGGTALKENLYTLAFEHRLLQNLILSGGVSLNVQNTLGTDREILTYQTTFGTEYRLNRNIYLTSLLSYTHYNSSTANSDYEIKSATIGVRLQQ